MNLPKRIIGLLLSFTLVYQQVAFAQITENNNFWDAMGVTGLQDSTHGLQQFKGPNGENVTSIGGSFTLKRRSSNYPLWFSLQGPSISASCSGISFKGMFGTLVNFDEIQRQLEEAGSSFAYGILVGLVYSLPGISEIFKTLDNWAKKIQKMLADSCKAGTQIGQMMGDKAVTAASDTVKDWWGPEDWAKNGENWDNAIEGVTNALDCASGMWENLGTPGDCEDGKFKVKNKVFGDSLAVPSIMTSVLLSELQKYGKIAGAAPTKGKFFKVNWKDVPGMNGYAIKDIAFAGIITSVVGDVVVDKKSALHIEKMITTLDKGDGGTAGGADAKAKKQAFEEAKKHDNEVNAFPSMGSMSISTAVKFLVWGNGINVNPVDDSGTGTTGTGTGTTGTGSTTTSDGLYHTFKKNYQLPQVWGYAEDDSGAKEASVTLMAVDTYNSAWMSGDAGLDPDIEGYLSGYAGVASTAQAMTDYYLNDNDTYGASTFASSALVPTDNMKFYAKVYRNTPESDRANLKEVYYYFALAELSNAMLEKIAHIQSDLASELKPRALIDPTAAMTGSSSGTSVDIQAISTKYLNHIRSIVKELRSFHEQLAEALKEYTEGMDSGDVRDVFMRQNKINLSQAYKKRS